MVRISPDKTLKFNLLKGGASLLALSLCFTASAVGQADADEIDALEARIEQLEAMLGELRAEVEAARSETEAVAQETETRMAETEARVDEVARTQSLDPEGAMSTAAATPPGNGFMAGDTTITYGGFIDLDAHVTSLSDGEFAPTSVARDFYIPGATPVGGTDDGGVDTDFTAQATRFFFTTSTPTDMGEVTSRLEFDFLVSPGGDERVSNSYNPRLRVAWAQLGNWRLGQDWSTFQNTSAIPESASFLVLSDGMVFVRQAQIRYTNGPFQFALENPDTTVTPFGGGARIDAGDGAWPDVVARYNHSGDFGNVSLSAIGRNLAFESDGIEADAFGWGLALQGRLSTGAGSDLRFTLAGGEGVGRYIGLNAVNGAVLTEDGDLEAIPVLGGLVAWRQSLGDGRRVIIGYSHLEADNDTNLTGLSATRSVYSAYGGYLFNIAPNVTLGAEILFGERELENGQTGSITRGTISTKYTF